ncbi:hypothetical protein BD769DRAFT_1681058 [Suillus cothurnatus]|nr:hypothetical protein BD769DRAFT_1681058 [Suillus cothurnatus]
MQRSLLFNALASMVILAVAYTMPGAIAEPVAKREDVARGVYFPISYDKKRSEEDAISYPMERSFVATTIKRAPRTMESHKTDKKGRDTWQ